MADDADDEFEHEPYHPLYNPLPQQTSPSAPVNCLKPAKSKKKHKSNTFIRGNDYSGHVFNRRPYTGALLFDNNDSDARDHAAAERTFLSWLRLATYMSIVSIAIVISFHLKHQPTRLERRVAVPFGIVFWLISLACLGSGINNYVKTVEKYSRRQALVQTGWGTQVVFTIVASAIIAACVLFLSTNAMTR